MIQSITISLKVDGMISWSWKQVLWSYWILFSIMIGINFGIFLIFCSKICQKIFESVDSYESLKIKKNKTFL